MNNYWNFKLVLQGQQSDEESDDAEWNDQSEPTISAPFLAQSTPESGGVPNRYQEQSHLTEPFTDPSAEDVEPEDEPNLAASELEVSTFVYPDADELDNLNVDELSAMRRRLALKFHPDRLGATGRQGQAAIMGRCNQLIDEAIGRKPLKAR